MSTDDEKGLSILLVINDGKSTAAICKCPAGETLTCVHVAALVHWTCDVSRRLTAAIRKCRMQCGCSAIF